MIKKIIGISVIAITLAVALPALAQYRSTTACASDARSGTLEIKVVGLENGAHFTKGPLSSGLDNYGWNGNKTYSGLPNGRYVVTAGVAGGYRTSVSPGVVEISCNSKTVTVTYTLASRTSPPPTPTPSPSPTPSPTPSPSPTPASPSDKIACVGRAVIVREGYMSGAVAAYTEALAGAYYTRTAALGAAYMQSTSNAEVKAAVRTAWANFRTSIRTASKAWSTRKLALWTEFRAALKACKASADISDSSYASYEIVGQ